jgi:hypothetical protein
MTAARKAALKKAQLASARARRGKGKRRLSPRTKRNLKRAAIGAAVVGVAAASVALKNPSGVRKVKKRVKYAQLKRHNKKQQKTFKKALHSNRAVVNSNQKRFLKYKTANPNKFKRHQPFGRPR